MPVNADKRSNHRGRDNKENERAEVRYFKGEDQFERWRKEFVQNQDYELKLAAVSKLNYEPVDYQGLLVREDFPELKLTDYSHLVGIAKTKAEQSYVYPITARIAGMVCLLGILVVIFSPITLLITAALGAAAGVSLHFTIKDRENAINKAEKDALETIAKKNDEERQAYEERKQKHDEKENERIGLVEKLITGDANSVRSRLDEVLNRLKLPVVVQVDIDFFNNIPVVKIWLPAKTVIPKQTCEMLPSGRLQYQDKDTRVYNKQYFELSAGIILQVMSTIMANIPSFQEGYAGGIIKNDLSDDCVLAVKVSREKIHSIERAPNAVAAIQAFDAVYECDTALALYPVDMLYPTDWEAIEQQSMKSLRVRIFK